MKPLIEILTRSPIILALFLNFARPPLIEPGSARDWIEAGSEPNPNKHVATSVRNATYEKVRLKSIVVDIL